MIEVFLYGCSTCGINSLMIARLKKVYPDVIVNNSVHLDNRRRHTSYLEHAGMDSKSFPPIIVINEGEAILSLSEWKLA